jgi:hypothetical protein
VNPVPRGIPGPPVPGGINTGTWPSRLGLDARPKTLFCKQKNIYFLRNPRSENRMPSGRISDGDDDDGDQINEGRNM